MYVYVCAYVCMLVLILYVPIKHWDSNILLVKIIIFSLGINTSSNNIFWIWVGKQANLRNVRGTKCYLIIQMCGYSQKLMSAFHIMATQISLNLKPNAGYENNVLKNGTF